MTLQPNCRICGYKKSDKVHHTDRCSKILQKQMADENKEVKKQDAIYPMRRYECFASGKKIAVANRNYSE